ncbi:unnamed protein product [Ranitomeya imitator]|uniref:Protein kinase domain-containing protein n=1 Tax=Ranitomeya imitator TaxID=111125 RepID=A0ABN9MF54_9NEOB|nr:unnamed protein product [Ranitomeya imitator]
MRLPIIGKNQNIVQIYNQEFIKISPEDIMHEGLKNRWSIRESEWHHKLFKMAFGRIKRSFPFITLLNTNKIICPPKINLRKPTSSLNPSKQIGKQSSNLNKLIKDLKKEQCIMQKASSNPHILQLIGVYGNPEDDLPEHGLVMKYMPNGSLLSLFDNDKIPDVPWALRFQIFHQVALGMNCLHSLDPPIIHRDLKPSNVLLDKHLDVQITDFGLSKIVGVTSSATPSFAGTWSYMAPEALKDINYRPTKSYDVYSYGILMWTLFSREEPYHGFKLYIYIYIYIIYIYIFLSPSITGRDAADIRRLVGEGQRPRISDVDEHSEVKMVPEAKDLMIRCWNQNAENRPSFHAVVPSVFSRAPPSSKNGGRMRSAPAESAGRQIRSKVHFDH